MRAALIFDTETTGLTFHPDADLSIQPRMIEFGGVLVEVETGKIIAEHSFLVNPGVDVSEEITGITGITNDDLLGKKQFKDLLAEFRGIFRAADVMLAHNLPFDRAIMVADLRRAGAEARFPWPAGACSIDIFRHKWGREPKLKELYLQYMGRPLEQKHRALDDVMALVDVLNASGVMRLL